MGTVDPERTPALAARFADEFNAPFSHAEGTGLQFDRVRAAVEAAGREAATMTYSAAQVVCVGADEAEVGRRATAIGRDPAELRENGACGTPDEVADRLGAFGDVGAERIYLQVLDLTDLDHLRLIADEVLPVLT